MKQTGACNNKSFHKGYCLHLHQILKTNIARNVQSVRRIHMSLEPYMYVPEVLTKNS